MIFRTCTICLCQVKLLKTKQIMDQCNSCMFTPTVFQCSVKCGKGRQTRLIKCVDIKLKKFMKEKHCRPSSRPEAYQQCIKSKCPYIWSTGDWSEVTSFLEQDRANFVTLNCYTRKPVAFVVINAYFSSEVNLQVC